MRYCVIEPSPALRGVVEHLWSLSDVPAHARERIVPTGTLELVVNLERDEFRIYDAAGVGERCRRFGGAIVSGCYSTPFVIDTREHASVMGVHFLPGGACGLLGASPGELADAHVGLEQLWGPCANELRERLCAAGDQRQRFKILEQSLLGRLGAAPSGNAVRAALPRLDRPGVEVGDVSRALGLSRRRFIEIFTADVGMTPKLYSRVRRFQRAIALAAQKPAASWAQVAIECGYFDQAHLCRDWAELGGCSPREFRALQATRVKDNHLALPDAGSNPSKTAAPPHA